jgi:hypothetical protein
MLQEAGLVFLSVLTMILAGSQWRVSGISGRRVIEGQPAARIVDLRAGVSI